MGDEICVVGFDPNVIGNHLEYDGKVKVYRLKNPYSNFFSPKFGHYSFNLKNELGRFYLSNELNRISKVERPDLIESYDWSGPLAYKLRIKTIVRLHGANFSHAFYNGARPVFLLKRSECKNILFAENLIAVSKHIGETTSKAMNRNLHYEVIYNGVDINFFSPKEIKPNELEILFVGSVNRRKGVFEFLKAAPYINDAMPEACFKFVGNISDNNALEVSRILNTFSKSLRSKFIFLGPVPQKQLPDIYRSTSVCVFPSLAEAFGLTCVEAMACGKPVVVTKYASGPELVENGESGLLADPKNPQEYATAVIGILKDRDLQVYLGNNGRQRTMQIFNIDNLAQTNRLFYKNQVS